MARADRVRFWALVLLLFVDRTALAEAPTSIVSPAPPQTTHDDASLRDLTASLVAALERYESARPDERESLLADLKALAAARQAALSGAINAHPAAALAVALDEKTRSRFPGTIRSSIEEKVTLEGWLGVMIADDFAHGRSQMYYSLIDALDGTGRRFGLYFADGRGPQVVSGGKFRVDGVKIGDAVVVASLREMEFIQARRPFGGSP